MNHRSFGAQAEAKAATYLQTLGWTILANNTHFRYGEIDILADSGSEIVVVEVKAKTGLSSGFAVEMLTPSKRRTLLRLAKSLTGQYNKPVRIDVITFDAVGTVAETMTHYPYAIGE